LAVGQDTISSADASANRSEEHDTGNQGNTGLNLAEFTRFAELSFWKDADYAAAFYQVAGSTKGASIRRSSLHGKGPENSKDRAQQPRGRAACTKTGSMSLV